MFIKNATFLYLFTFLLILQEICYAGTLKPDIFTFGEFKIVASKDNESEFTAWHLTIYRENKLIGRIFAPFVHPFTYLRVYKDTPKKNYETLGVDIPGMGSGGFVVTLLITRKPNNKYLLNWISSIRGEGDYIDWIDIDRDGVKEFITYGTLYMTKKTYGINKSNSCMPGLYKVIYFSEGKYADTYQRFSDFYIKLANYKLYNKRYKYHSSEECINAYVDSIVSAFYIYVSKGCRASKVFLKEHQPSLDNNRIGLIIEHFDRIISKSLVDCNLFTCIN